MFSKKKKKKQNKNYATYEQSNQINGMLGTKSNTWEGKKIFNNHINHFVNLNNKELSINMCLKSITSQDPTAWIILN